MKNSIRIGMTKLLPEYSELDIHRKLYIKQHAINVYGKQWHVSKPDFCQRLNCLQVCTLLGL